MRETEQIGKDGRQVVIKTHGTYLIIEEVVLVAEVIVQTSLVKLTGRIAEMQSPVQTYHHCKSY
tara:strand:+ start:305 stop:496 length:192 start_codon:yes stop_codon:yes gene_type:complete